MIAFVANDDGKTVTLASSEWARAMRYIRRLETLVEDLLENDPNDLVADGGYTLLDAWRADARRALRKDK